MDANNPRNEMLKLLKSAVRSGNATAALLLAMAEERENTSDKLAALVLRLSDITKSGDDFAALTREASTLISESADRTARLNEAWAALVRTDD